MEFVKPVIAVFLYSSSFVVFKYVLTRHLVTADGVDLALFIGMSTLIIIGGLIQNG